MTSSCAQRGHRRLNLSLSARITAGNLGAGGLSLSMVGRCANLSLGGMGLTMGATLSLGQRVQVEVELDDQTVVMESRVVWSRPRRGDIPAAAGVQFVDDSGLASALAELLGLPADRERQPAQFPEGTVRPRRERLQFKPLTSASPPAAGRKGRHVQTMTALSADDAD